MANKIIYNGSPGAISGSTPFGFYDLDPVYQLEGPKVANFCARKLGYPIMEVELQDTNFYTCFEEAITTYGNEVYLFKIRDNYINLEGASTGSSLNNTVITPNLTNIVNLSIGYGEIIGIGGFTNWYSASLDLQHGQQVYDLKDWATNVLGINDDKITVQRIFYEPYPSAVRFFDPYGTQGFDQMSLAENWGWGGYSTAVSQMLYPVYWDIQRIQQIEQSDYVRRSHFSFELTNNVLRIFPIPASGTHVHNAGKLWIHYAKNSEMNDPFKGPFEGQDNLISNISNVPYTQPIYSQINVPGRYWIYAYAAALAKEMLAYIRGKYTQVPIPGDNVTLNQSDLLSDARSEKKDLIEKLRQDLEESTRKNQLERKKAEAESMKGILTEIPLMVYIG
jgi:hypothetical protein